MSASPDYMTKLFAGLNDALSSPLGTLALSLIGQAGPQDHPHSTGQDIARGYAQSQQLQSAGMQNKAQGIALNRSLAYLKALQEGGVPPGQPPQGAGAAPAAPAPQGDLAVPGSFSINGGNPLAGGAPPAAPQSPAQAPGGSNPLLGGNGQAAPARNPLAGSDPASDGILQDQELQRDLALSNAAPDAPTQTAWLTRARLRYDTLAGTPAYKGQVESATAAADLPFKVRESMAGQLGRVTTLNPGEGQIAVSGLSLASPELINWLSGGQPPGTGGGAPAGAAPAGGGAPTSRPGAPPLNASGGNMSGVPTPFIQTPGGGGLSTQNAVYSTNLQKKLADEDAAYMTSLQTNADSATAGRQNVEEMWQAYHGGILTGKFSDFKESFLKGASALGMPMGNLDQVLSNTESFTKNQAQLGISLAKSVSSRPSQFEFKYLNSNAVANPNLQKASVPLLLSQMEGNQVYSQQKALYVNQMAEKGVNPRKAALDFDSNASSMPYVLQAMASRDPETYRTLRAQMQSNATGKAFEKQLEREASWMKQQGMLQTDDQAQEQQ